MHNLSTNYSFFKPLNVITEYVIILVNVIKGTWVEQVPNNYNSGTHLMWSWILGTPCTLSNEFKQFGHKNTIKHENRTPLDFLTSPDTSTKTIWKQLFIYECDHAISDNNN